MEIPCGYGMQNGRFVMADAPWRSLLRMHALDFYIVDKATIRIRKIDSAGFPTDWKGFLKRVIDDSEK
jgi:hypothetical protein